MVDRLIPFTHSLLLKVYGKKSCPFFKKCISRGDLIGPAPPKTLRGPSLEPGMLRQGTCSKVKTYFQLSNRSREMHVQSKQGQKRTPPFPIKKIITI